MEKRPNMIMWLYRVINTNNTNMFLCSSFCNLQVCLKEHSLGNEAWSIGSVRASGTEGSEFEPSFRHPFLCGGLWQDLVIPCVWDTTVIACR